MEGSARSSVLFDARRTAPAPFGGPRTFRRLQVDLSDVRREHARLKAAVDHRDDDPRLMMGAGIGASTLPPLCPTPCSSTTLPQRLRRAIINDDLPTARRLFQRALAEAASAPRGPTAASSATSRGAIVRNITAARSSRRLPHYPRGSIEAETHLGHVTSLELAIMYSCSIQLVEWLLDTGHEEGHEAAWTRDEQGRSIPHLAAISNRADIVALYCSRFDAHDVADLLDTTGESSVAPVTSPGSLAAGAASLPALGRTALHDAAMRGYDAVVLVLLSRGSDPRRLDGYGNTALHYASSFGHLTTLQILMDAARETRGEEAGERGGSDEEDEDDVDGGVSSALFGIKNDGGFSAADYAFTLSDRAALEALGRKWFADNREKERRKKAAAAERAAAAVAAKTVTRDTVPDAPRPSTSTRPQRRGSTLERLKSGAKDVVSGAVAIATPRSPRASSPRPTSPRTTSPRTTSSSPPSSPSRRGSLAAATTMLPHPRLAPIAGPPSSSFLASSESNSRPRASEVGIGE